MIVTYFFSTRLDLQELVVAFTEDEITMIIQESLADQTENSAHRCARSAYLNGQHLLEIRTDPTLACSFSFVFFCGSHCDQQKSTHV
jgi:hypothetical protein